MERIGRVPSLIGHCVRPARCLSYAPCSVRRPTPTTARAQAAQVGGWIFFPKRRALMKGTVTTVSEQMKADLDACGLQIAREKMCVREKR